MYSLTKRDRAESERIIREKGNYVEGKSRAISRA